VVTSNQEERKQLEFRTQETTTFHLSVNGRHLPGWLLRLLRPIERPIHNWLKRRGSQ
jgi:hypothetical protein